MGLESISEPDDMDLDEEDEEAVEGEGEQFFDTLSQSGSASVSSASNNGENRVGRRRKRRDEQGQSEEVDTEEDPVGPETPGPTSRFDIINPPLMRRKKGKGHDVEDEDVEQEGDLAFRAEDAEGFGDEESDIEDDWIDPSLPTPTPTGPPVPAKDNKSYAASSSSSPPSSSNLPPLAKGKAASSAPSSSAKVASSSSAPAKSASGSGSGSGKTKRTKKQVPVPVPAVRLPVPPQEHYPFPVAPVDDLSSSTGSIAAPLYNQDGKERMRNSSTKGGRSNQGQGLGQGGPPTQHRMHTARARDGGRTQSGGVKGILTDD